MKVLILVLSADFPPYDKMIETAMNTWDVVEQEGTETIFYCGKSSKSDTGKIVYLPIREGLFNMGHKTVAAFEWALQNKEFDFIARVHSSIYVDKKTLYDYIQTLPQTKVFAGAEATSQNGFQYLWGGIGMILSKDVVQRIVANKDRWVHSLMEDESMSKLVTDCGVPFSKCHPACSIDKQPDKNWKCISYFGHGKDFTDFSEIKDLRHVLYRVKNDSDRNVDEYVMNELFKHLR